MKVKSVAVRADGRRKLVVGGRQRAGNVLQRLSVSVQSGGERLGVLVSNERGLPGDFLHVALLEENRK